MVVPSSEIASAFHTLWRFGFFALGGVYSLARLLFDCFHVSRPEIHPIISIKCYPDFLAAVIKYMPLGY